MKNTLYKRNFYLNEIDLTKREYEVLVLLVDGLSNPEIAERIIVSESTAKAHVSSILNKFGVKNRVKVAVLAVRNGIV